MKRTNLNTLFIVAICFCSCQAKHSKIINSIKPESITVTCEEYASIETEFGVVNNNLWNKHAAEEDNWNQCLEQRGVENLVQYGWSWSWPRSRRVVYAYPQIKVGSSPWAPEPKFDDRFPLRITELQELRLSHSLEIYADGDYNVAATMWLTREPYKGKEPKPSIIAAEVMIWTYATENHFDPAGSKYGELEIDNKTWEVWAEKKWSDTSGINENEWTNVTFRAQEFSLEYTVELLDLLNHAIQGNLLSPDLWVADLELGNEVMSGNGATWVKEFDVQIK